MLLVKGKQPNFLLPQYISHYFSGKHPKFTLELLYLSLGSISDCISFRVWMNCGQFIPCCISLKCIIYYNSDIGYVCLRTMKYLYVICVPFFKMWGKILRGKFFWAILIDVPSIIIPKLFCFYANLKLSFLWLKIIWVK